MAKSLCKLILITLVDHSYAISPGGGAFLGSLHNVPAGTTDPKAGLMLVAYLMFYSLIIAIAAFIALNLYQKHRHKKTRQGKPDC